MSVIDELVAHNRAYVDRHGHREMATRRNCISRS